MGTFGSTSSATVIKTSDEITTYVAAVAQPISAVLTNLVTIGFDGDQKSVLTGSSTIAANRVRTIGGRLQINDGGGVLVIEDNGALAIV